MEIIRNKDVIQLVDNKTVIEEYRFDVEINFSKLMQYLISLNLSTKLDYIDNIQDKKVEEENLIIIIKNIIDDYNKKVEELSLFKKNVEQKDDQSTD